VIYGSIAGRRNVGFFERVSFGALLILLQIESFDLVGINPVEKLIFPQQPLLLLLDECLPFL
jgi:hypothetical protein